MRTLMVSLLAIILLPANILNAQVKFTWMKDKPGKWQYNYRINTSSAEEIRFKKQVEELSEWFHQNVPLFKKPMGFDVKVHVSRSESERQAKSPAHDALSANLSFNLELFARDGKPWKAELPSASYYNYPCLNRIAGSGSWLGSIGQFDSFNNTKHDPKLEDAINRAASKLDEMMTVFPRERELAPGLHLYKCQARGTFVVVFRPDRPAYLIPVTLRELAEACTNYYSLFQTLEIDRMLLKELKKELAAFSETDLNRPAYAGHPSNVVFPYSSDSRNLPIMKMNPDYWDRSLPSSAIQLMVFWDPGFSEQEMTAHLERFGYPIHSQILVNQINWNDMVKFVARKQ
ncbi:MAG TPA: hypothetical protein PKO06_06615 [Candidatus Ozemobacteraceae bacterium]|mgnify:CR=1 FL=1|nr:hypothetical protein [Candidatus Ozemobacteraceae bacterium]